MEQVSYILLSHFFLKQKKKTELNEIKLGLFISVNFFGKSMYIYKFHIVFPDLAISLNLRNCITNTPNLITIL